MLSGHSVKDEVKYISIGLYTATSGLFPVRTNTGFLVESSQITLNFIR